MKSCSIHVFPVHSPFATLHFPETQICLFVTAVFLSRICSPWYESMMRRNAWKICSHAGTSQPTLLSWASTWFSYYEQSALCESEYTRSLCHLESMRKVPCVCWGIWGMLEWAIVRLVVTVLCWRWPYLASNKTFLKRCFCFVIYPMFTSTQTYTYAYASRMLERGWRNTQAIVQSSRREGHFDRQQRWSATQTRRSRSWKRFPAGRARFPVSIQSEERRPDTRPLGNDCWHNSKNYRVS